MKTTKGGKVMNPTDAFRKELRKRELKRIVGTSKTFQKRKKHSAALASNSEDSHSSSSHHGHGKRKFQSFTPPTPPPTVNYRTASRRKGIPHRAPMGVIMGY